MSDQVQSIDGDEIDLLEILETLWHGKWIVFGLSVLAGVLGYGATLLQGPPRFEVSAPYTVEVHSVLSQRICVSGDQQKLECLSEVTAMDLLRDFEPEWTIDTSESILRLSTMLPQVAEDYNTILLSASEQSMLTVREEALAELAILEDLRSSSLAINQNEVTASPRVEEGLLIVKRVLQQTEGGQPAILFGAVTIDKIEQSNTRMLLLAVLAGGFFGAIVVLLRSAIHKRSQSRV